MKSGLHVFMGVIVLLSFAWMMICGLVSEDSTHVMYAGATFILAGLGMSLCE